MEKIQQKIDKILFSDKYYFCLISSNPYELFLQHQKILKILFKESDMKFDTAADYRERKKLYSNLLGVFKDNLKNV
tara:strand:+ start:449 stop:676 length:228 start_codon:yes stop_codon:yes gene_type:complete